MHNALTLGTWWLLECIPFSDRIQFVFKNLNQKSLTRFNCAKHELWWAWVECFWQLLNFGFGIAKTSSTPKNTYDKQTRFFSSICIKEIKHCFHYQLNIWNVKNVILKKYKILKTNEETVMVPYCRTVFWMLIWLASSVVNESFLIWWQVTLKTLLNYYIVMILHYSLIYPLARPGESEVCIINDLVGKNKFIQNSF